jgi:trafficking protein particle complex subunit 11
LNHAKVNTSIIFWLSEAFVDERVAFQLSLTAPSDIVISTLPFSSLAIYFSHKEQPIVVHHNASAMAASKFQRVDLGDLPLEIAAEREGCLRWEKDATILFVGTVSSDVPLTMTVCSYRQQISHV